MKIYILRIMVFLLGGLMLPVPVFAQTEVSPTPHPTSALDRFRAAQYPECDANKLIRAPATVLKYLKWNDLCVKPTMIVIHFTGEWSDPDETIAILNERGLGCHLATRRKELLQLLDFYENEVERAGCAAGYNNFAVHNEISGVAFDEVIEDPSHIYYEELIESTDTAVKSTCWIMEQYDIPFTQLFAHHEITPGKPDPGPIYMEYFRKQIKNECL